MVLRASVTACGSAGINDRRVSALARAAHSQRYINPRDRTVRAIITRLLQHLPLQRPLDISDLSTDMGTSPSLPTPSRLACRTDKPLMSLLLNPQDLQVSLLSVSRVVVVLTSTLDLCRCILRYILSSVAMVWQSGTFPIVVLRLLLHEELTVQCNRFSPLGADSSASYDTDPSSYASQATSTRNSSTRYVRTHSPPTLASGPAAPPRHPVSDLAPRPLLAC